MPKSDVFPKILPQVGSFNLKGLTLYELYRREEINTHNMKLLELWLDEYWNFETYGYWIQFHRLDKKLKRTIRLKRLKLWLLSLIGH